MIQLHPKILEKNGQPKFAVLPYEEFRAMREILLDYEDLRDLRATRLKESGAPTISSKEVQKNMGKLCKSLENLRELNQAIKRNGTKPLIPWTMVKKELGLV
ncbi:MAG: hypothetical protein ACR2H1_12160 [Limisphaerales bacterium]